MSTISLAQLVAHARPWSEEDLLELADYARVIDFVDASVMEQLARRHRA